MGRKGELTQAQSSLRARYQEALAAYRERRWDDALGALEAAVEVMPGDGPSMTLKRRLDGLKANPPPEDWDASWHIQK
jgi:adenylate cyclase